MAEKLKRQDHRTGLFCRTCDLHAKAITGEKSENLVT